MKAGTLEVKIGVLLDFDQQRIEAKSRGGSAGRQEERLNELGNVRFFTFGVDSADLQMVRGEVYVVLFGVGQGLGLRVVVGKRKELLLVAGEADFRV